MKPSRKDHHVSLGKPRPLRNLPEDVEDDVRRDGDGMTELTHNSQSYLNPLLCRLYAAILNRRIVS